MWWRGAGRSEVRTPCPSARQDNDCTTARVLGRRAEKSSQALFPALKEICVSFVKLLAVCKEYLNNSVVSKITFLHT